MSAVERFTFKAHKWQGATSSIASAEGGEYVRHSDYAALESRNAELEAKCSLLDSAKRAREHEVDTMFEQIQALLRRVDDLETRVALADVLAQRVAGAPVFRDDGFATSLYAALSMLKDLKGKRIAFVVLEDHESGGEGA